MATENVIPAVPEGAPPLLPPGAAAPIAPEPPSEPSPEATGVRWDDFISHDLNTPSDDAAQDETPAVEAPTAEAETAPAKPDVPPAESAVAIPAVPPPAEPAAAPQVGTPVTLEQLKALFATQSAAPAPSTEPPKAVDTAEQQVKRRQALAAQYRLSEEQSAKFLTEPEVVVPEVAAALHEAVLADVQALMHQAFPQMFAQMTTLRDREQEARNMLFSGADDLKGREPEVLQIGAFWRQMNPTATPQQAVEGIRTLSRTLLGIQPPATTTPAPQPAVPAPSGFRPAGVGGSGAAPAKPSNIWVQMAEESED
jgi:hypothetical protein